MPANKYLKPPWIEALLMAVVLACAFIVLALISFASEIPSEGMSSPKIFSMILLFFLLSFMISLIAAITGIGGGVLFTPIMLAFTPVDSLIVRATGLLIAMFTGLISSGPVMKKGLANLRMCIVFAIAYGGGAFSGAQGAIYIWKYLGDTGEAWIRMGLGIIVGLVSLYLFAGGKKVEWPAVRTPDRFTRRLDLSQSYYEHSLRKVVDYDVSRFGLGIFLVFFLGVLSGFFGLGAGWAIVPMQNLVVGAPLKVAAANSLVLLGIGDSIAVWPYFLTGAIIPLFAAPWIVGVVCGGRLGAFFLIKVRAGFIRCFLIGILFFTGFSLIMRGLEIMGIISMRGWIYAAVFLAIAVFVFRTAMVDKKSCSCSGDGP